jgi:hypothetical protein
MQLVTDIVTKKGDRVGDRQAEKVVGLCARAWSVVHRLHPEMFDRDVPNPWRGVA